MQAVRNQSRTRLRVGAATGLYAVAADPPAMRRSYGEVGLMLPHLSDAESAMWERALNRPLKGSGSTLAGVGLLVSATGYLAYLALSGSSLALSWTQLITGVAVMLGGSAVGKVLGLFYWNLVLTRTARRLARFATESRQILTGAQSVTVEPPPTRPLHSSAMH